MTEQTTGSKGPMLAYILSHPDAEAMVIAFAPTQAEARTLSERSNWLQDIPIDEIQTRREPKADHFASDVPELLDGDNLKSATVMHALGWSCIDEPNCEWCGAGQFESVPESHVSPRADHADEEICQGCYDYDKKK